MNNYILQRALTYYFLMCEINESEDGLWEFVCDKFGIDDKDKTSIEQSLDSPTLHELKTMEDIYLYCTYLDGLCCNAAEFGKSEEERLIVDIKFAALTKTAELFERVNVKGNRIKRLSLTYKESHVASVLYALQIMFTNKNEECLKIAREVLCNELTSGNNSDAGLILLNADRTESVFKSFCSLPDMVLQSSLLKELAEKYGMKNGGFSLSKTQIGFKMQ